VEAACALVVRDARKKLKDFAFRGGGVHSAEGATYCALKAINLQL
jgi:hypothetical protein